MRARTKLSWSPTPDAGLHHHHIEIWNSSGLPVVNIDLGSSEYQTEVLLDENQYYNIYVYSMNSQNQGNAASVGFYVPGYVEPTPTPSEPIPGAPNNLAVEIIGWEQ